MAGEALWDRHWREDSGRVSATFFLSQCLSHNATPAMSCHGTNEGVCVPHSAANWGTNACRHATRLHV